MTAKDVLKERAPSLLWRQGAQAAGLGYKEVNGKKTGQHCIIVSVRKKQPKSKLASRDLVPTSLDGYPTDVIETGQIRALATTDKVRPCPGGMSIGHRKITAGTLGCLVKRGGVTYILSNNHVLANSNSAAKGDAITQPGPHDGGILPDDLIAELEDFVPINFGGTPDDGSSCPIANGMASFANFVAAIFDSKTRLRAVKPFAAPNLVDAAIARPIIPENVIDTILEIGTPAGVGEALLGMTVQKSGRTTGHKTGPVTQTSVITRVSYGSAGDAVFEDQIMVGQPGFSAGGDSGSAVLDENRNLVGLLFAGSDQVTICNRIQNVLSLLQLTR